MTHTKEHDKQRNELRKTKDVLELFGLTKCVRSLLAPAIHALPAVAIRPAVSRSWLGRDPLFGKHCLRASKLVNCNIISTGKSTY